MVCEMGTGQIVVDETRVQLKQFQETENSFTLMTPVPIVFLSRFQFLIDFFLLLVPFLYAFRRVWLLYLASGCLRSSFSLYLTHTRANPNIRHIQSIHMKWKRNSFVFLFVLFFSLLNWKSIPIRTIYSSFWFCHRIKGKKKQSFFFINWS